jgi:hypothetical protein
MIHRMSHRSIDDDAKEEGGPLERCTKEDILGSPTKESTHPHHGDGLSELNRHKERLMEGGAVALLWVESFQNCIC